MEVELWKTLPKDGKQNRLIAKKINDTTTKLVLYVVKPGVKWSKDVIISVSFDVLVDAFKGNTEWSQPWHYDELNGVFRAVRTICLPKINFKLYWMVLHIEYKVDGESQFQVLDQFFGCSSLPLPIK